MFGPSSSARFGLLQRSPPQSSSQVQSEDEDESGYCVISDIADGDDNSNMSGIPRSDSARSLSSLNEQIGPEDTARCELRKLSLDQHGTFMADFDPEKSQREMRKMNRRIYSKEAKKNILYDENGIHLETLADVCDCLDKGCPGCHFPCRRCGSPKCGADCRCNRKYIVDLIEVEGTSTFYQ
ncbi:unnamed protein product [Candidula unifasciata]|uniref:ARF7 effector protein C-terminal domain-containing protein n=1 Tax=Candidula unifasciata TaxID=100452 RepID=A0A8S3YDM6_9EUPU|nr:unnamed protein product [Candidula unifasciata]